MDRIAPARWNLLSVAALGGIVGLGLGVISALGAGPVSVPYLVGQLVGSSFACAVLFGLVAGVRNMVTRAR